MKKEILTKHEQKFVDKFIFQLKAFQNRYKICFEKLLIQHKRNDITSKIVIDFVFKVDSDPDFINTHFSLEFSERSVKYIYSIINKIIKEAKLPVPRTTEHLISPFIEPRKRLYNHDKEIKIGSLILLPTSDRRKVFIIDWSSSLNVLYFWNNQGSDKFEFPEAIKAIPLDKLTNLHIRNY